jgi:3-dehydroquinate dehydratase/shikimate dehydrogenase
MAELIARRDAAVAADMVELRLDGVADVDVAGALAGRKKPAIVTCRAAWEGGRFDGSETERRAILLRALELDAQYVDVEFDALASLQRTPQFDDIVHADRSRVIVSRHDFAGVPDLPSLAQGLRGTGAAIIKIAVTARRLSDCLGLRDIGKGGDAVVIAMGDAGLPSRLLASKFGSRWTYAGDGVAPGQIPASRMIDRYRFRDVTSSTSVFGVVGTHAMHSLSPVMHNAALAAAGIDAVYVPLCAADFTDALSFANGLGLDGMSVTIPFKIDALTAASEVDALARQVGAVNTLRRGGMDDGWEATNTDVEGFLEPLTQAYPGSLNGAHVSVLGAGGAARAAIVALRSRGASVTVHARHRERGEILAASFRTALGPWPPPPGSWDVLVNCTPLGGPAAPDESPMAGRPLDGALVYDLNYGATEPPLVRAARAAGLRALDGVPMLVAQAERQFEYWFGQRPPAGVMRDAALAATGHGATERPRYENQLR